ncbi:hypothetical protein [Limobrevibacterium gyesilva]|uniref:hypothetical protein n=1 Tax=Limobrevibacterium gyesilva TaxID=2991712 RepID=UPI002226945F|nr:hypothetical protein [Limobrevibacterium gyesilva]
MAALADDVPYDGGADETAATGQQNPHRVLAIAKFADLTWQCRTIRAILPVRQRNIGGPSIGPGVAV